VSGRSKSNLLTVRQIKHIGLANFSLAMNPPDRSTWILDDLLGALYLVLYLDLVRSIFRRFSLKEINSTKQNDPISFKQLYEKVKNN